MNETICTDCRFFADSEVPVTRCIPKENFASKFASPAGFLAPTALSAPGHLSIPLSCMLEPPLLFRGQGLYLCRALACIFKLIPALALCNLYVVTKIMTSGVWVTHAV